MTAINIEFQALGPCRDIYINQAKTYTSKFKSADISLTIPQLDSDSKWSSVIIAIDNALPIKLLTPFINQLIDIREGESGNKTDISIHDRRTNTFYDLPEQWPLLVEEFTAELQTPMLAATAPTITFVIKDGSGTHLY